MLLQQGDILLKLTEGPYWLGCYGTFYKAKNGRFTIAKGEKTGHAHVAIGNKLMVLDPQTFGRVNNEPLEPDIFLIASDDEPFTIVHEEHDDIIVPAGTWSVEKVKEYDHFSENILEVKD